MLLRRWAGVMKGTRYFAGGLCKAPGLIAHLSEVHCGMMVLGATTRFLARGQWDLLRNQVQQIV